MESMKNLAYYKRHMIVAAEFNSSDDLLTVMYSNFALHGAPISLNLITNVLIKSLAGEKYDIQLSNAPLREFNVNSSPKQLSEVKVGLVWLTLFPIGKTTLLNV